MIALDTNLLVYAHREDSTFHAAALDCVRRLAEGRGAWALPWPCVHEFLAALCLQHGVHELWSADRDFGRFPRLRTVNPLVAG